MRSELRKLSYLPTPKWTLVACLSAVLIATVVVAISGPGDEHLALIFGIGVSTWIGSIVLGVWMAGLEYGQKTMRRTLSRQPDRVKVAMSKIAVAVVATVGLTLITTLVAAPLYALVSSGADEPIRVADTIKVGLGSLANNLVYTVIGFSLGLVTRSMAGGMTVALGFFFVIDSLLTAIPKVGDLMISPISNEILQSIAGNEIVGTDLEVNLARAIVASVVWMALFVGASSLIFRSKDVD